MASRISGVLVFDDLGLYTTANIYSHDSVAINLIGTRQFTKNRKVFILTDSFFYINREILGFAWSVTFINSNYVIDPPK